MPSPAFLRQIVFSIAVVWSAEVSAQTYPSRPITLVAPFAAGSGVDVMARRIAADLSPRLGQPIIVENKPGAGSVIGAEFVAKAAPITLPAPGLFSTMTGCPSRGDRSAAILRAITSTPLPAANGATSVIGRDG